MKLFCGTPQFAAPELVIEKGYSRAVDSWSSGVILFYIISGKRPFNSEDSTELDKDICEARYSFEGHDFSPAAKDLITRLLKVDPLQRYSVKEALAHPWAKSEFEKSLDDLPPSVFEMLRIKTRTKSMLEAGLSATTPTPSPVSSEAISRTSSMSGVSAAGNRSPSVTDMDVLMNRSPVTALLQKTELPRAPERAVPDADQTGGAETLGSGPQPFKGTTWTPVLGKVRARNAAF